MLDNIGRTSYKADGVVKSSKFLLSHPENLNFVTIQMLFSNYLDAGTYLQAGLQPVTG